MLRSPFYKKRGIMDMSKMFNAATLESLTNSDLTEAINQLLEERKRREIKKQEEAWLKVRKAINEYLNDYSKITVICGDDSIWIENGCLDTTEEGVIDCK